jgi:hypothetical protein
MTYHDVTAPDGKNVGTPATITPEPAATPFYPPRTNSSAMSDDDGDGDGDGRPAVTRPATRSPGTDPDDPYEGVDVASLPDWWRRAIETFEAHGLRPYRPPRFADGRLTHEVIAGLEADLGVEVGLGSVDSDYRERWEVRVDGDPVAEVGRHRDPEGYTVYEIDGEAFAALVRDAVDPAGAGADPAPDP